MLYFRDRGLIMSYIKYDEGLKEYYERANCSHRDPDTGKDTIDNITTDKDYPNTIMCCRKCAYTFKLPFCEDSKIK